MCQCLQDKEDLGCERNESPWLLSGEDTKQM